jgi:hypothetical protein
VMRLFMVGFPLKRGPPAQRARYCAAPGARLLAIAGGRVIRAPDVRHCLSSCD